MHRYKSPLNLRAFVTKWSNHLSAGTSHISHAKSGEQRLLGWGRFQARPREVRRRRRRIDATREATGQGDGQVNLRPSAVALYFEIHLAAFDPWGNILQGHSGEAGHPDHPDFGKSYVCADQTTFDSRQNSLKPRLLIETSLDSIVA